ncbi:MAG TPA: DUF2277 family protein [Acidimicrobiales bacterium]|nr:DUF2277 family protein [Acidimicrobiales bacterium]
MCRSITALRGLEPPASDDEVTDAARQYVKKVGSLTSAAQLSWPGVERAVAEVAAATRRMLDDLPERKRPPATVPPTRR